MWELWVRKLTNILSKNGLPTRVRKDTDKSKTAKPSPFVSFIRELQACLPAKYRRSHALRPDVEANVALSTAIVRSRPSRRSQRAPRSARNKPRNHPRHRRTTPRPHDAGSGAGRLPAKGSMQQWSGFVLTQTNNAGTRQQLRHWKATRARNGAQRIIHAATLGERDPVRLRQAALRRRD